MKSFAFETFKHTKEQHQRARAVGKKLSAYAVRLWSEERQTYVEGYGSTVRVAAMRAVERAVAEGWL